MKTISILLVGSYVVPLAVILVFAILYFVRYKKYLLHKNSCKDCQFLEDAWKSYIFARLWHEECRTGFKLWWYFFGSRYIDLVNYTSERCVYELGQLDCFEGPHDNRSCFHRKAFMRHWEEIRATLFDKVLNSHGYSDENSPYEFKPEFNANPFGWMTVMIESKLFELYKKHALQLLRTKGYYKFSEFLLSNYKESEKYPHNAAFSIIASGKFHEKIMWANSQEIGERVQHEVKVILGLNNNPKNESQVEKLQSLVSTFVLGGGYSGTYYLGLSETRTEIYNLLEKAKISA